MWRGWGLGGRPAPTVGAGGPLNSHPGPIGTSGEQKEEEQEYEQEGDLREEMVMMGTLVSDSEGEHEQGKGWARVSC